MLILLCPTAALSMRDLGWKRRVGARQGSVLFGHNLDKTTDRRWSCPCLLVIAVSLAKHLLSTGAYQAVCWGLKRNDSVSLSRVIRAFVLCSRSLWLIRFKYGNVQPGPGSRLQGE